MTEECGDSLMQNIGHQSEDGGIYPTSPLQIISITKYEAKDFIGKYHYLGYKPFRCSYAFGLSCGILMGVSVYHGLSAPETAVGAFGLQRNEQMGLWELGRLAVKPEFNGKNYGSFLIRRSIMLLRKQIQVKAVIAYADSTYHNGAIYQAAGFTYCGLTDKKKDYFINGMIRERGKTKGAGGEWHNRPRKYKYIVILDKSLNLRWSILPYPKRNLCQNV